MYFSFRFAGTAFAVFFGFPFVGAAIAFYGFILVLCIAAGVTLKVSTKGVSSSMAGSYWLGLFAFVVVIFNYLGFAKFLTT